MPSDFFQLPPNSTGAKVATRTEIQGPDTVHVQYVDQREERTFIVWALATAPANLKSMLSLLNASATEIIEIQEIFITNSAVAAITGVLHDFRLFRITGHSVGTALTIKPMDTTEALPAGIDAKTGGTVAGEEATPLDKWIMQGDEVKVTTADAPALETVWGNLLPKWEMTQRKAKSIILRQNQGITIKELINTAVGSFDVGVVFTLKNL